MNLRVLIIYHGWRISSSWSRQIHEYIYQWQRKHSMDKYFLLWEIDAQLHKSAMAQPLFSWAKDLAHMLYYYIKMVFILIQERNNICIHFINWNNGGGKDVKAVWPRLHEKYVSRSRLSAQFPYFCNNISHTKVTVFKFSKQAKLGLGTKD